MTSVRKQFKIPAAAASKALEFGEFEGLSESALYAEWIEAIALHGTDATPTAEPRRVQVIVDDEILEQAEAVCEEAGVSLREALIHEANAIDLL